MQQLAEALSELPWEEIEAIALGNQPDPEDEQSTQKLSRRGYDWGDDEDDGVEVHYAY